MPPALQFVVLLLVGWVNRQQQDVIAHLKEERRVLRELLGPGRLRFTDAQRRRLAVTGKPLGRAVLDALGGIVTPDTILRWFHALVARKYDGTARRGPGRPRTAGALAALVVRVATENPTHGYTRIRDVLAIVGVEIGRSTVKRILDEHGIVPAPERRKRTSWRDFLAAHWDALAAADFFNVEVLTRRGLVRYAVLVVMRLATRRVEIAGITPDPHEAWMRQVARNLTDAVDGFLLGVRHLILDRDPLYTAGFRDLLEGAGVNVVRLPARSPNFNAYVERFVLSIKSECLDRLVLLGEGHLRDAIRAYVAYYHGERPHQGLGSRLIAPDETAGRTIGRIACRKRLGGLLKYYYRKVA